MRHIQKSHFLCHISDAQGRIFQKLLGLLDPNGIEDFRKALFQMFVQQLAQMPLADKGVLSHFT